MDTDIIRNAVEEKESRVIVVGHFPPRGHLAYKLFWWLIGTLSFTIVVDLILVTLDLIRI